MYIDHEVVAFSSSSTIFLLDNDPQAKDNSSDLTTLAKHLNMTPAQLETVSTLLKLNGTDPIEKLKVKLT